MSRLPVLVSAALLYATTAAAAPVLSPSASTGWFAYSRVFIPPPGGSGPVRSDPAHPLISNDEFRDSGKQPSFPMGDPASPILKPWVADAVRKNNERILAGKPAYSLHATCRPVGVPDFLLMPMTIPMYIVQGPKEVVLILEHFADVRHIYLTDKHRRDLKPSWYGDSIGHYEGDTLVVDTIGLNDTTSVDEFKTPHTTQLHVVEHFHLIEGGKLLEVKIHVEDPGAFTTPWDAIQRFRKYEQVITGKSVASVALLATPEEGPLIEAICAENPNSLMGLTDLSVPQTTVPDF